MNFVGIDFGGTNIKIGFFINHDLKEFETIKSQQGKTFSKLIKKIEEAIDYFIKIYGHIDGVGIALPGIVNTKEKKLMSVNKKYEEALKFDFNLWIKEKYDCAINMDNDARSALLGELTYGVAKGYNNAVMFILGTGVGSAAYVDGSMLIGHNFQAGILGGHLTIDINGPMCTCGNLGCVEVMTSRGNFYKNYQELNKETLMTNYDFSEIFDAYRSKDRKITPILDKFFTYWGQGVVNLIHSFSPEVVVLSGGVLASQEIILPKIDEYVSRYSWIKKKSVEIVSADKSNHSVILGLLAMFQSKINGGK